MPQIRPRPRLHQLSIVVAILTVWSLGSTAFHVIAQDKGGLPNYDLGSSRSSGGLFSGINGGADKDAKPTVEFKLAPADAKPGDEVTLSIAVAMPPGSYTYSTNKEFIGATRINIADPKGLEPVDGEFQADHAPKSVFEPVFKKKLEKFSDKVTWSRKFRLLPDAKPADASVKLLLDYQVCNESRCLPLQEAREITLAGATSIDPKSIPIKAAPRPSTSPAPTAKHDFTFRERPKVQGKAGPAEISATLEPENAKPGETVTLRVGIKLDPEWHTYSITQAQGQAATPTAIKVAGVNGLTPLDETFTPNEQAKIKETDVLGTVYRQEVHEGEVSWSRKYKVGAADYGLAGSIKYQTCTGENCLLAKTISFALGNAPAPTKPETAKTPITIANNDAGPSAAAALPAEHPASAGLVPFILTAMLAGFAALLTPCVFPMVPITVSFFLKQSEKQHHKPVTMALVYCAGIVATFTVLGISMAAIFRASQLNTLANNPWLNLGIAGVLVFFGLNLLGLFEIRIPASLLTWSSGKEGSGGMIGVLFMALTFTLVSFTCTFAFVGGLLVLAANGQFYWPIVGMLAFSSAFALPFFFLALFPSFLQKLPKSGGWMNRVKVTIGILECGAALKFLSVADLSWNPVPIFFDYAFVMSAWAVLALATGMYLLGIFRLPHDTPSDSVSVPRFIASISFIGLAAYLSVGLFGAEKPTGRLWETIAAFAPPKFSAAETELLGPILQHDGLEYALDFERALEMAQATQQPVFFDFTGVNCVNCRKMEIVMAQPLLRDRLQKFVRAQLYADNVPTIADSNLADAILAKNRDLQETWFGDVTLPAYAIVTPDKELLISIKGASPPEAFAEFLDRGLSEWSKRSGTAAASKENGRPMTASR